MNEAAAAVRHDELINFQYPVGEDQLPVPNVDESRAGGIGDDYLPAIHQDVADCVAGAISQGDSCRGGNRAPANRKCSASRFPCAKIDVICCQEAAGNHELQTAI